jgi:hypothetical protein
LAQLTPAAQVVLLVEAVAAAAAAQMQRVQMHLDLFVVSVWEQVGLEALYRTRSQPTTQLVWISWAFCFFSTNRHAIGSGEYGPHSGIYFPSDNNILEAQTVSDVDSERFHVDVQQHFLLQALLP